MAFDTDETFGTPPQQALLGRGRALYDVVGNDPRFAYCGRTVGFVGPEDGSINQLAALAGLQGSSMIGIMPDTALPGHQAEAQALGLSTTHYAGWRGGGDAMQAARDVLGRYKLPKHVTVAPINAAASPVTLAKLAEVALACGVLPPTGAVLRGTLKPGLAYVALDDNGRPLACAAAASFQHPDRDGPEPECWWGMLATMPEQRGQHLALTVGAMAMLEMNARFGFSRFFTGVEPGNTASEAVCNRMGLRNSGQGTLTVADASVLPGGRMTK